MPDARRFAAGMLVLLVVPGCSRGPDTRVARAGAGPRAHQEAPPATSRAASAEEPEAFRLDRVVVVSGPCGGNLCQPATAEALSLCAGGAAVRYTRTPWSDVVGASVPEDRLVAWGGGRVPHDVDACRPNPGGRELEVTGSGWVRRRDDSSVVGHLSLPRPPATSASREITEVVADEHRLAVIVTDRTRVSVGVAPCCTRLLLFTRN